ncbi:MAG: 50S ribosomal protein L14 [Aigarchaeota archaeon]|nr:50S ribosomal protein L14 [Aigarchaeota archaeon]MDW8092205.1 50S ribosomal protein L14 [Nitrososphaerota archaeon]
MSKRSRAVAEVGTLLRVPDVPRTITKGAYIHCSDNSGAQELRVIQVLGFKQRLRRQPAAGVGDLVAVTVKKGNAELRGKPMHAIIIRQRKPYRRPDGTWIMFEDTAAVLVTPEGDVKASEIRGPVAKEAAERWAKIANIAGIII